MAAVERQAGRVYDMDTAAAAEEERVAAVERQLAWCMKLQGAPRADHTTLLSLASAGASRPSLRVEEVSRLAVEHGLCSSSALFVAFLDGSLPGSMRDSLTDADKEG